jgi:hypothetical protein
MRTLSFALFVLVVASGATAAPEAKPTPAVCKADLKAWSGSGPESKTETLTLGQLQTRMNEMVACADEANQHWHSEKRVLMYLDVFYRTHSQLADRALDFITNHNLRDQFYEEEGSGTNSESASIKTEEKH